MRKTLKYIICISIISLIGICSIKAETTAKYIRQDGKDQNFWIEIDKEKVSVQENIGVVYYKFKDNNNNSGSLFTSVYDSAYLNKEKWWNTIYYCYESDKTWLVFNQEEERIAYTSSLESYIRDQEFNALLGFAQAMTNGELAECNTLVVQDIPKKDQISFCKIYTDYAKKINELSQKYMSDPRIQYITEYREVLELIKASCNRAIQSADYNDSCVDVCLKAEDDYKAWDSIFNATASDAHCGLSRRIITWLLNIIRWVKYLLPVAVIILGILDFIKAMSKNKSDEMNQSQKRFVKRLIAAALVFLIPLIIQFVLIKLGFKYDGCGIF